jgi:hypothetical protein
MPAEAQPKEKNMTTTNGKWIRLLSGVFFASLLSGCTAVPTKHFSAYKEAFGKARAASEQVLLDYGAATAETEALKAALTQEEESRLDQVNARRQAEFDVNAARNNAASVDHIAVRMQAWDVVGRYNEALTGLAEGKSAAEVAGLVDGLYQNLSTFPFEGIAEAASDAAPFVGALKTLLKKAQEEWSRQEFVRVVKEGGPTIRKMFIVNLRRDAQNFYNIRLALNDIAYREKLDEIADLADQFNTLANRYKLDAAAEDLVKITDDTNAILWQVHQTAASGARKPTRQFQAFIAEMEKVIETIGKNSPIAALKTLKEIVGKSKGMVEKAKAAKKKTKKKASG